MNRFPLIVLLLATGSWPALAQVTPRSQPRPQPFDSTALQLGFDTLFVRRPVSFTDYVRRVGQFNLGFAAQQFGLTLAQASVEQARILPDPTLAAGYFNNGQARLQTGYGFSAQLTQTLELGRKRRARVNLAQSQRGLAQATVADFFRLLRADASLAFLEGIRRQRAFQIQVRNYGYLRQLAEANQQRFRSGALTEVDAIQSRVEAEVVLNAVNQAGADWKTALLTLGQFRGGLRPDTLEQPVGDLTRFDRPFAVDELITNAQNTRADLLAARQGQDVARKALDLARANRMIDLDVALTNNFVGRINNIIEPTPSYNTVGVGLAIPLKFSNRYNAELRVARLQILQADLIYRQVDIQIEVDVRQAYEQYLAARRQVQRFDSDLLGRARRVLEGRIYAYNRGGASLLEVLTARQTFNEVELAYNEALAGYGAALINLERAAGIWDIDF